MEKEILHKTVIDGVDVVLEFKDNKLKLEVDVSADKSIDFLEKLIPGKFDDAALEFLRGVLKS